MNVPHEFVVAPYNDLAGTRALIARTPATTSPRILVEPMLGAGGCIPARPDSSPCCGSEADALRRRC